jgi:BON domain
MKQKAAFLSACLLTVILSAGVGCAKKPDDSQISSDIQNRFSQDSGLSSKQLTVQTDAGVVTLSGNVDNDAQRDAARRQAAAVPGVRTVIDNLHVGPAAASNASANMPTLKQASTTSPATDSKSAPENRTRKARADSNFPENSAADSNTNQTIANNDAPPPAAAAPAPPADTAPATPPPPPSPKKLIIDQGTQLTVRLIDPIDSEKNQTGDTFHATLNAPLSSDGEEAVPAGVELTGHLVEVKSASKFAGKSSVAMQLDSLSTGGKTYNLQTDEYRKETAARGKNTAEKVGGGAVLGGIIGAIAGGGKGAAIGAAAGAGAGGGVQAASKKQTIKLPSETVLNFTLQAPITVV